MDLRIQKMEFLTLDLIMIIFGVVVNRFIAMAYLVYLTIYSKGQQKNHLYHYTIVFHL